MTCLLVARRDGLQLSTRLRQVAALASAVMIFLGIALLGYCGVAFDTSVPLESGKRIHNIGLMQSQENGLIIGAVLLIGGIIVRTRSNRPQSATHAAGFEPVPAPIGVPATSQKIHGRSWLSTALIVAAVLGLLALIGYALMGQAEKRLEDARDADVAATKKRTLLGQIEDLPAGEFSARLAGIAERAGYDCPSVTRTYRQGFTTAGDTLFNIQCSSPTGGFLATYMIRFVNDGHDTTSVVSCLGMKRVSGADCWIPIAK